MADHFAPIDGVRSRKAHCVELIESLEPGSQIPWSEVTDLLDCSRTAAYAAMREAALYLEGRGSQSVVTRESFGWEVIARDEAMLRKAQRRLVKTARAGDRAAKTTLAVDRDQLGRFDQQELDQLKANVARVAELKSRKTRSLAEIARQADQLRREIPDQRVRELPRRPERRSEGA